MGTKTITMVITLDRGRNSSQRSERLDRLFKAIQ